MTTTRWKVEPRKDIAYGWLITEDDRAKVCYVDSRFIAAQIVREHNAHDNLVAALEDLLAGMIRCANMQNQATRDRAKDYIDRAQNTLRLAKELGK